MLQNSALFDVKFSVSGLDGYGFSLERRFNLTLLFPISQTQKVAWEVVDCLGGNRDFSLLQIADFDAPSCYLTELCLVVPITRWKHNALTLVVDTHRMKESTTSLVERLGSFLVSVNPKIVAL